MIICTFENLVAIISLLYFPVSNPCIRKLLCIRPGRTVHHICFQNSQCPTVSSENRAAALEDHPRLINRIESINNFHSVSETLQTHRVTCRVEVRRHFQKQTKYKEKFNEFLNKWYRQKICKQSLISVSELFTNPLIYYAS